MRKPFLNSVWGNGIAFLAIALFSLCYQAWVPRKTFGISHPKWLWNDRHVLQSEPRDIDYLFVGSSMTWCDIDAARVAREIGPQVTASNIAVPWAGFKLHYHLIRETLKRHRVKNVVVELNPLMNVPHRYEPFVMTPGYFMKAAAAYLGNFPLTRPRELKQTLPKYLSTAGILLTRPVTDLWHRLSPHPATAEVDSPCERTVTELLMSQAEADRRKAALDRKRRGRLLPTRLVLTEDTLSTFHRLDEEVRRAGARLQLAYLPNYGMDVPPAADFAPLNGKGRLFVPRVDTLDRNAYWRDLTHLWKKGTQAFSRQLAGFLAPDGQREIASPEMPSPAGSPLKRGRKNEHKRSRKGDT